MKRESLTGRCTSYEDSLPRARWGVVLARKKNEGRVGSTYDMAREEHRKHIWGAEGTGRHGDSPTRLNAQNRSIKCRDNVE